ncbi:histidine phosphatase family protein [Ovoidimarina sediminis]|uniref:histidine phosphatase family protein n=1 Tax=Ovoidimarina sediminis TaxID=3079856 RepID=UPI00290CFB54|nr:histidine phosphatase family protein [Rhodophyticola sp. MJ-SS7]MDU8943185.1 histidine phosphatase family protein [Rhodophyticola sp. MJ-SS7]
MILHVIRHGETETSGKTYAGRSDVPLNDRGRAEAQEIARRLGDQPITLILTSPLARAVETAAPLASIRGVVPVEEPALMEIDFGIYEGCPKAETGLRLRKTHAVDPVPGGEALRDVWGRAGQVLHKVGRTGVAPGAHIALVGHFWINRLIHGRATGMTFDAACRARAYRPRTGSVETVAFGVADDARRWPKNGHTAPA